MTKIKSIIPLLVLTVLFSLPYLPMTAQEKKLFTLEDLNYGGTNFRNLQPENKWFSWWGDQLMYLEAEEGGLVDQKGNQQSVFLLKDLGEGWHSAYSAEYPYPQQPLVLLENSRQKFSTIGKQSKSHGLRTAKERTTATGTNNQRQ